MTWTPVRRDSSASLPALRPASQGIASTIARSPSPAASADLDRHRVDVAEVEVGLHQDRPAAVDDDVLVGVGDPELGRVDVAEHGPDERHATTSRTRQLEDRAAPASRSCSAATGTSRGSVPPATAIAAAVPAAWPIAMHCAIERTEACASWVAEKQRPATRTFEASRTTSAR